jgi:hypothetical protein
MYCIDAPQRIVTKIKSLYRTVPPFSVLNGLNAWRKLVCLDGGQAPPAAAEPETSPQRKLSPKQKPYFTLKGLSHEIDFKNVDENGQILALSRAAAGF